VTEIPQPLTVTDVLNARFAVTKFREGYDQDQVDLLLDRVADALRPSHERRFPTAITRQEVQDSRFKATKFRAGYDQHHVDDFLDRAAASLPL
jgi:DivIVA domain-containing protein